MEDAVAPHRCSSESREEFLSLAAADGPAETLALATLTWPIAANISAKTVVEDENTLEQAATAEDAGPEEMLAENTLEKSLSINEMMGEAVMDNPSADVEMRKEHICSNEIINDEIINNETINDVIIIDNLIADTTDKEMEVEKTSTDKVLKDSVKVECAPVETNIGLDTIIGGETTEDEKIENAELENKRTRNPPIIMTSNDEMTESDATIEDTSDEAVNIAQVQRPTPETIVSKPEESKSTAPQPSVIKATPSYFYDNGIPVFRPTYDAFRDFDTFIRSVDAWGQRFGIVKVIPPSEWSNALPDIRPQLETVRIAHPISQHFEGSGGVFKQMNVEERLIYSVQEFVKLSMTKEFRPPYLENEVQITAERRRSRRSADDDTNLFAGSRSSQGAPHTTFTTDASELDGEKLNSNTELNKDNYETGTLDVQDHEVTETKVDSSTEAGDDEKQSQTIKPTTCYFSTACDFIQSEKKRKRRAGEIDLDALIQQGPYTDEMLTCKFNTDYYHELERIYWRSLCFSLPMYGADMLGTLFLENDPPTWNMNRLDKILSVIPKRLSGVNVPYLYFGMWKATFAWHVEDADLYSINYLHFGAPKQWYAIPPEYSEKFQQLCRSVYPEDYRKCSEFIRHKILHFSPRTLATQGIPVNRVIQEKGEFILTFPKGYHAGYNLGFNCAESVNFATRRWIELGKKAKSCRCVADSVVVDAYMVERLLDGGSGANIMEFLDNSPKIRRSMVNSAGRSRKDFSKTMRPTSAGSKKVAQIIIPLKSYKCLLCIDESDETLLKVADRAGYAHRNCADYIPETWVGTVAPTVSEQSDGTALNEKKGKEVIYGFNWVPKDRFLLLRCAYCRVKHGACIQCAKGKCTRSFHVTCAQRNKVHFTTRDVFAITGESFTVYDAYCSQHDPADLRKQELAYQKEKLMSSLNVGSGVWVKRRQDGLWYFGIIANIDAGNNYDCKVKIKTDRSAQCDVISAYWYELSLEEPELKVEALVQNTDPYIYYRP